MSYSQIVPLIVITATYGLVVLAGAGILRKLTIPFRRSIILSLFIFGVATGLLMVWLWPRETIALINVFAMLLGDEIYQRAIEFLGDPHSDQAHSTIPWLLRIPQVYMVASIMCSGLVAGAYVLAVRFNERFARV